MLHVSGALLLFLCCCFDRAAAVCPWCSGNLEACTWDTDTLCPTQVVVAVNAAVIANTAAPGICLTLGALIKPRWLRAFTRSTLDAIVALARRPAPGVPFSMTVTTGLSDILRAIAGGQFTSELALMRYAELIDASTDADITERLVRNVKLLSATKDIKAFTLTESIASSEAGYFTFLWAKISDFVSNVGMVSRASLDVITPTTSAGAATLPVVSGVFTARVIRPRTWIEFMEGLNLFMMYVTALGLTSAIILTDFFEHVIFDTMRMKDRTWQFAHELMLVMFRRIEDSSGTLNLGNVYDSVHLNSLLEETDRNLAHFYPTQADCFRTHGANPGAELGDNKSDTKPTTGVKWNSKFSSTNSRPCAAFNGNRVHNANELLPDGTCKRNHICDQWVDNKGKDGKCLCEKGAHGHSRAKCDHPNKSDRIV